MRYGFALKVVRDRDCCKPHWSSLKNYRIPSSWCFTKFDLLYMPYGTLSRFAAAYPLKYILQLLSGEEFLKGMIELVESLCDEVIRDPGQRGRSGGRGYCCRCNLNVGTGRAWLFLP